MMRRFLSAVLFAGCLAFGPAAARAQVKYLNQLSGAASIAGTDTLPLCQTAGGCGAGNALASATIAQLNAYFQGQLYPSESANTVLAGPVSGSAGAAGFRMLVAADMPGTPPAYKTGSYTLAAGDMNNPVCLKGAGGAATFTLPTPGSAAAPAGAVYVVCDDDATNNLTAATPSGGFFGFPTNPLTANMWAVFISDGTNWQVMER